MGKGLGGKLLEAGEQKLLSVWEGIERIVAQVLPSNKASMKLFVKAQYQQAVQTFYKQVIS
jgi:RimJ/RimL family protein N-acetyltransferase